MSHLQDRLTTMKVVMGWVVSRLISHDVSFAEMDNPHLCGLSISAYKSKCVKYTDDDEDKDDDED